MNFMVIAVLCSLFTLLTPCSALTDEASSVTIFFLGSGSADAPWTQEVSQGLIDVINQSRHPYIYSIDHLEASRFDEVKQYDLMFRYLKEKFAYREPDFFIAAGPAASTFSTLYPNLFPESKRILISPRNDKQAYAALNNQGRKAIIINPDMDYAVMVKELTRLSNPKKVFIVGDSKNPSDRYRLNRVAYALDQENILYEILDNMALMDLLETVSDLPDESAIFFTPIYREYEGKGLTPVLVMKKLHEVANSPIFSDSDSTLGFGTVGGYLYSPKKLGNVAGEAVRSIIRNEPVNTSRSCFNLAYDWNEVSRWGYRGLIRQEAKTLFREPSIWERYRKVVISTTIVFSLLTFLSTSLFLSNRQLKKAKITISKERLLLKKRVDERTKELSLLHKQAEKTARTDDLTNLSNRRDFFEKGELIHSQAQRYHRPYSIMMLDIDLFKTINDTHGHAVGDIVIQSVAKIILSIIRQSDIAARIGGEEYAVILVETEHGQLHSLAERVRYQVATTPIIYEKGTINTTVSIGAAQYQEGDRGIESILDRADKALYHAKQTGRNKVII